VTSSSRTAGCEAGKNCCGDAEGAPVVVALTLRGFAAGGLKTPHRRRLVTAGLPLARMPGDEQKGKRRGQERHQVIR